MPMAPPADLADIGRDGFDLLEKAYGHSRVPEIAPPPPPLAANATSQKEWQEQPCVFRRTEVPLISERLPQYVIYHPSSTLQYQQPGYPSFHRIDVPLHHHFYSNYHHHRNPYPTAEDDADAVDSKRATHLFKRITIVEYRWG
ncbi:hypothetical protein BT93_B0965 [Corymbia citriodora subsp. variegata]|nr:hypothetical protein BT93_B0965 [Corymbia citriodora subsp. variegata]